MMLLVVLMISFFVAIVNLFYQLKNKDNLESGFIKEALDGVYSFVYPKNIKLACQKVSLPYYELMKNYKILREENPHEKLRQMVVLRTIGYMAIPFGLFVYMLTQEPATFLFAIALAYGTAIYPQKKVDGDVKGIKADIESELPRFIDLLLSALSVNMPTDVAIRVTAEQLDGVLAKIMREATSETTLGRSSWEEALLGVSNLYQIGLLSDFIMDITTAHEKGLSVVDSLRVKSEIIKESFILEKEKRTGMLKTTIYLPIFLFKILPIVLLMMIPLLISFSKGNNFF